MVNVVIGEIAAHDPAAAAEYWQQAGLAELGVYPANRIARHWAPRDADAAERWAVALPAGAGRDSALLTIIDLGAHDSARAAVLVNQIGDERMRGSAAWEWLHKAIARRDPSVAEITIRATIEANARGGAACSRAR